MTVEERQIIKQAKRVNVAVCGPHDVFYTRVNKAEAIRLVSEAQGQLEVIELDGEAFVEARI